MSLDISMSPDKYFKHLAYEAFLYLLKHKRSAPLCHIAKGIFQVKNY